MGAVAKRAEELIRSGEKDQTKILDELIAAGGKMSTLHLLEDLYGLAVHAIHSSTKER